ncbi:MAG: hypothetical protein U0228_10965 [Myxococcaceae bacterium]
MARIDSGSSNAAAIAAQARAAAAAEAKKKAAAEAKKKAAAEAAKKAAAEAAKKKAAEAAKRKDGFDPKKHLGALDKNYTGGKDLKGLANGKGTQTINKDGSVTNKHESTKKGTTTSESLTTHRNKWTGQSDLKFESSSKTPTSATNYRETKHTYEAHQDLLHRTTSTQGKEVSIKKGNTTNTDSHQVATNQYGQKTVTDAHTKAVEKGDTTTSHTDSTTKGAFNTKQKTVTDKTEVKHEGKADAKTGAFGLKSLKDAETTTTTTKTDTRGTNFALSHSSEFKDGKFTLKDSADWKKQSFNKEVGKEKEWKLKDAPKPDAGFTQKAVDGKQGKLDKLQKAGDLLGAAGVKKEWKGKEWDNVKLDELDGEKARFAGSKVGTSGSSSVSVGANGVDAKFKREAVAGLYAQHNDSVTGAHGTASYKAGAKLEAKAGVDAQGKLNLNGLDASVNARVGVSAEASISGKLESNSLGKIGGVDVKVGAEGTAKVSAEAEAHANGSVKITRNPPAAIAEGSVGASAVAKAEAEVKVSAGPFSVKASGYASAGAEAKASGVIGYQDGKLKIGGSAGAALGLGLGGSVNVEVDVKQIGTMAKNTAIKYGDQNGDGKLGLDDVTAGAKKLGTGAAHVASDVAHGAAHLASDAAHGVANAASNATHAVANAASNVTHAAASAVSSAASTVRSWLPW